HAGAGGGLRRLRQRDPLRVLLLPRDRRLDGGGRTDPHGSRTGGRMTVPGTLPLLASFAEVEQRAVAALEQAILVRAENRKKFEATQRRNAIDQLVGAMARIIGYQVERDDVRDWTMKGGYEVVGVMLRGWVFTSSYSFGDTYLRALQKCADCDGYLTAEIRTLEDFGAWLMSPPTRGAHRHSFLEDSEHPNAPKPEPFKPAEEEKPEPTAGEQLVELIRSIVREELPYG